MSKRERGSGDDGVNEIGIRSLLSGGMYVMYVMDVLVDVMFWGRVEDVGLLFIDATNSRIVVTNTSDWFGQRTYVSCNPQFNAFLEMIQERCQYVCVIDPGDVIRLCHMYRLVVFNKCIGSGTSKKRCVKQFD